MRTLILLYIYLCTTTISYAQPLLGKGTVKIALKDPSLLLNGVKVYPGDQLTFITEGTVRKNWWIEPKESCFLWFCDKYEIAHHNFNNPNTLPARVYIKSNDGVTVKADGFELKQGPVPVSIPADAYSYDKPFELFGVFPDPSIVRNKSDGEYVVHVSISFAGRLAYFKTFLQNSDNNLTYALISSKNVISDLFGETHGETIARLVLAHLDAHPGISTQNRKDILQFLYTQLSPTNPSISLAIAKNALQSYDLTTAAQAIRDAKTLITSNGAAEDIKAHAHGLMGYYLLATHERLQDRSTMLEASTNFGSAAELYVKNSMYDSAISAYYKQATSLRRLGETGYLEQSLEILKKAERLTSKLLTVTKNNKYGLVSLLGATIIPPTYEELRFSQSYLIPAKKGGKWGFVDKTGNVIIQPLYDEIGEFKEGVAWTRLGEDHFYIDQKGKQLIAEKFNFTSDFYRNFAFVLAKDGIFYYINRKGNKFATVNENHLNSIACGGGFQPLGFQPPPAPVACDMPKKLKELRHSVKQMQIIGVIAGRFFNGLTLAPFNRAREPQDPLNRANDAIGFIDENGEIARAADPGITNYQLNKNNFVLTTSANFVKVLDARTLAEKPFSPTPRQSTVNMLGNGGMAFWYNDAPNVRGLMNDQNKIVAQPKYLWVGAIDPSLTFVSNDQHFAAVKQDGADLFRYPSENSIVEWYACCTFFQNYSGFGNVPQPRSSERYTFSNFVHVKLRDKANFQLKKSMVISQVDGSVFIQEPMDWFGYLEPEKNLFVAGRLNGEGILMKYGIYKVGRGLILPCNYEGLEVGINHDFAIVYADKKYQLVDYENESLSDWSYDSLSFYSEELLIAKKNEKYGLVSLKNETIVPFEYENLSNLDHWLNFPFLSYDRVSQPFMQFNGFPKLRSRIISFTENGKKGIISITDRKPIVSALYDHIIYMDDKLIGINYEVKADDKDYYSFVIHSYFGNKFIDDTFFYLRYDETDKTFVGITDQNQLKIFNTTGEVLLSAPITIQNGDIFNTVADHKYVLGDAKLYMKQNQIVKGPIKKFVKLRNRILLQQASKLVIVNMDSGLIKQAEADNVVSDRIIN